MSRLWEVTVKCWYKVRGNNAQRNIERVFLLEAPTSAEALEAGWRHADSTANPSKVWKGFEATKAASVHLPLELPRRP